MAVSAAIIMAAGQGKRMHSKLPKVLHKIAGKSMLAHVVTAVSAVRPDNLIVVLGHEKEQVEPVLREISPDAIVATQEQMDGTGGAVRAGMKPLGDISGTILVTNGDVPLLTGETLEQLVEAHFAGGNQATVLSAIVPDPSGYGRVIREHGQVAFIREDRDATDTERAVKEINTGFYMFEADALRTALEKLTPINDQGEYYLTDTIEIIAKAGGRVGSLPIDDHAQLEGVNDRVQLADRAAEFNRRITRKWMLAGVTIVDPATTWIEADVELAPDVTLLPGTHLQGATSVAADAVIGPDTTLKDVEVGEGAEVCRTHGSLSVIEAGATVGPFSYLRPGTVVGKNGKVGAFVECKNAKIGEGTKVPHLTYCGDAVLGERVNIGAGTIFANYDGVVKSVSTVGDDSFIGSNSVLVAPVHVAAGAYVAAGSALTEDVGPGQLGVARSRQHNSDGWVSKRRAGTKTEEAALRAEVTK
ncbi:MAG: bifunctional UDP-N-acetylglucosamine diphosphorylase/glucosamine-1-phosphate N-acetyltransferase GlmU [Propionibacteriaceae bacterium]|jgi:bifunctional UDP-N-acetylglucosamine pyrophosphorylase/glucosamine-1-phosphate N-acetyltransferase|nr:bifunctional UDP-N-acetylglucosamine diphosphorylase/glucosamine-1-phosphate N-acetyltransferase GlmU [Propionibacteriaceae bacterium]